MTEPIARPDPRAAMPAGDGSSAAPGGHLSRLRSRRKDVATAARSLLVALGSTPEGIARHLEEAGVRGVPGDAAACAVARYLSAVIGADRAVRSVRVHRLSVDLLPSARWRRKATVPLPSAVRRFVVAFDDHAFPRLHVAAVPTVVDAGERGEGDPSLR